MLISDVLELTNQPEGAKLEFKRDDERPEIFAKEIVAFANMNGGTVLVGVEDDGNISGIQRNNLQEWLMDTVIGRHVHPLLLPDYEEISVEGKRVAVVKIPQGNSKPYVLNHRNRQDIYVRYGGTSQLAGREQQARLFDSGGLLSAEKFPVHGSSVSDLDQHRCQEYFRDILLQSPDEDLQEMMINHSFLVGDATPLACSYFAYALFAKKPELRLPQAGVRLSVYDGNDKDYNTVFDKVLDAPLLERRGSGGPHDPLEPALHERAGTLIQPYVSKEKLHGMSRRRFWDYPFEAIRELLINAFIHRDWTKQDYVRVVVYNNRMEITSPGSLPNGMTTERIRSGAQLQRNPSAVRIFRDYGYVEDQGIGIRRKVIPLMQQHNEREPDFEVTEDHFKVTLWKKQ
ncbi:MAG: putative DNA binding domain-containing protein [Nitrospira sp.]|nr:putative DNA binding domain-containing protein [Nitrospira sp.]MDE0405137.1 putative DNA binding domain-containing protein [Nitrospira sp.]MDE0485791.1 putative DNA binding domain-containing protein [Nitrospira sp.]